MSDKIAELCASVAEAAIEAQGWLDHPANAEIVGAEKKPVRRQLRRGGLRARRLAEAAARPMCVSVFGPSQAGKSFLMSVLARPKGGRLVADYDAPDGKLDFINQINPEGEGESTGIVTRFTIRRYDAPPGFPVKLRLLSEGDVARILANTFLLDGDKTEPEPTAEEIEETLARLKGRAGASPSAALSADAMMETQDYLERSFGRSTYVAGLATFWDVAIDLAPRLSAADRGELLSLIWGRHAPFTRLYVRLAQALESLGAPAEAFAGIDALQPREVSIIDVKLLDGLDDEGGPTLTLRAPDGRTATLAKSVVTALTAELVLPMAQTPYPLFEGADLLDFPGARTRFEKPLGKFLQEAAGPLKECVLRGKVAYLFDRYVSEQEITAMLLCIADSNMEVADLPKLVEDWIAHTHGATPAARAQAEKLLFFVLTKFDKHLIDSAGSSDDPRTRFERRVQASLLEKFATMSESWPNDWTGGRPFDNCYWLRNPNYPAEAVIEYEDGVEIGFIERKKDRIAALKEGCVSADLVRRHFRDPVAAWDAAMALNDGGVGYLVEHLTPVCRIEIKQRQIAGQLSETAAQLARAIRGFHVSDDLHKRLEERRAAAQALVGELLVVYEHRLFGALLDALTIRAGALADAMRHTPQDVRIVPSRGGGSGGASGRGAAAGASGAPALPGGVSLPGASAQPAGSLGGLVLPGGVSAQAAAKAAPNGADRIRAMTRAEWRAETAFGLWVARLRAFAGDDTLPNRLSLSPQAAGEMANELIAAARRLDLQGAIARAMDEAAFLERGDAGSVAGATIAAELLNRFSVEAAASFVPLSERPDIAAEGGPIKPFAPRPQTDGLERLPADPRRADATYLTSWMHMIYALFEQNAMDGDSGAVDPEQNARLGAVIDTFARA